MSDDLPPDLSPDEMEAPESSWAANVIEKADAELAALEQLQSGMNAARNRAHQWRQEQADAELAAGKQESKAEQILPDGLGLTVDAVRQLLHQKNGISVPRDDPMLMQVTMLNAYLNEQQRLQKKHENALAAFMGKQTGAHIEAVNKSVAQLSETLSGVTVKGIQEAARDFVADMSSLRSALWLCTAIMACSALVNVAVFVLRAVRNG